MKAKSQVIKEIDERAIDAFKSHQIIDRSENWILLCRIDEDGRRRSDFATEIFFGKLGHLYVGGDACMQCFAYSYSKTIEGAVRWIGGCYSSSDLYIQEKATIGLGSPVDSTRSLDHECVESDLCSVLLDFREYGQRAKAKRIVEAIRDIRSGLFGCEFILGELLNEGVFDCDDLDSISRLGRVPSWSLANAWAALRRTSEILDRGQNS